jgi:shikimate dehydrogenase
MRKFGLVGESLTHSFSSSFFAHYFEKEKIEAEYSNYEISSIEEITSVFSTTDLCGLNVTFPYKESILPFLDELADSAKSIGAVNVIEFKGGKKIGHNTDAYGFQKSIQPFLTNLHERAMIIGTGGASKAVASVFRSLGIDPLFITRTPKAAHQFGYDEINQHMLKACKVIVHCTPVGTCPHIQNVIPFPFEYLSKDHLVIDLIYNPDKTSFLQKAEEMGATILNGRSMLHQQAIKAWEIWNI